MYIKANNTYTVTVFCITYFGGNFDYQFLSIAQVLVHSLAQYPFMRFSFGRQLQKAYDKNSWNTKYSLLMIFLKLFKLHATNVILDSTDPVDLFIR